MKISAIIENLRQKKKPVFSFEFFPPKTEKSYQHLLQTIQNLKKLSPAFVSITYGAGGSTRQKTQQLSVTIQKDIGLETMAHLTCVGSTQDEIYDIISKYEEQGIQNILALRGDPPKDQDFFQPPEHGFAYANELVSFIRQKTDQAFALGVAGYPEKHPDAPSFEQDLINLKKKIDAGAQFIITQLFLDNQFFFEFIDQARKMGIHAPILAGIMPVSDYGQIQRFTETIGATIPDKLRGYLEQASNESQSNPEQIKEEVKKIGIEWATKQCEDLLQSGVDGIHFYTLNKSLPTIQIFNNLTSS